MDKEVKSVIEEMSSSDFLIFLYSERDREDSLNKNYGWTNYALAGSVIAVVCLLYNIIDEHHVIWRDVIIYLSGLCSVLLYAIFFVRILFRRRIVDTNKVKFLREVFPWGYYLISCVTAIALFVCSTFVYDLEQIKWWWTLFLFILLGIGVTSYLSRDEIVPSYFNSAYFPCNIANTLYAACVGALMGLIHLVSVNMMIWDVFSSSFQVSVLISSLIFLLYMLLHINLQNKNVNFLDNLIDCYIHGYLTQDAVCHELRRHYLGYGVIEACYTDLKHIEGLVESCEEKLPILNAIKSKLVSDDYVVCSMPKDIKDLKNILSLIDAALDASRNLLKRVEKIKSIINKGKCPFEIEFVYRKNDELYCKIDQLKIEIAAVTDVIQEKSMNIPPCRKCLK